VKSHFFYFWKKTFKNRKKNRPLILSPVRQ